MASTIRNALFGIATAAGVVFVNRYFPDLFLFLQSLVCLVASYVFFLRLKDDKRLIHYAHKAHPLRLALVLVPGVIIGVFLWLYSAVGAYYFFYGRFPGIIYLMFPAQRDTLPYGDHPNFLLILFLSSCNILISTLLFLIIKGTTIGLRNRFGLAKNPDRDPPSRLIRGAVKELAKLLDEAQFKDIKPAATELLETISCKYLSEELIEEHLRRHVGWFKRQLDQHVEKLRSIPMTKPLSYEQYEFSEECEDDFIDLLSEVYIFKASENNYFYNLLMAETHPMIWCFAIDAIHNAYLYDFAKQPRLVEKILSEWQHADTLLKSSPAVLGVIAAFLYGVVLDIKRNEDTQHLETFKTMGRQLVAEGHQLKSQLAEDEEEFLQSTIELLESSLA